MALKLCPISLRDANSFVAEHHRHHKPVVGHKFSVACMDDSGIIRGVAIVGRPVSRHLDDGNTLEVNRLCTDGAKNACSMLYSAAWRAAKAMGYRRIVTYILDTEGGGSLRAAGWHCDGSAGGPNWTGERERQIELFPQMKIRYSSSRKKQKLGPFEEQRKQFFIFYRPKAIIDISKHQGTIDFDALKECAALVICRASCGSDKDVRFDEYAKAMNQRGIPFGVYCYSYCRDAAKGEDEAIKLYKYASEYKPLFYCIDIEEECVTQAGVKAFVKALRDLNVKRIGAYVAHHRYKQYGFDSLRSLFGFSWIPRYKSDDDGMATGTIPSWVCDLWQFTSNARIPGINGRVDMNIITGDGHDLAWFLGGD